MGDKVGHASAEDQVEGLCRAAEQEEGQAKGVSRFLNSLVLTVTQLRGLLLACLILPFC